MSKAIYLLTAVIAVIAAVAFVIWLTDPVRIQNEVNERAAQQLLRDYQNGKFPGQAVVIILSHANVERFAAASLP